MKSILIVEHAPNRADGILKHLAEASDKLQCHVWRCCNTASPPEVPFDALILSGGPMMVDDLLNGSCRFFRTEQYLVRQTVSRNIPLWGICLGAEILTYLYGGRVEQRDWVIGWHEVTTTAPGLADPLFKGTDVFNTFQLHRDHITAVPDGAVRLSTSPNSEFEAFRLQPDLNVWASIFHPEIDTDQAKYIYDALPTLFTKYGVDRQMLSPSADGRSQRSRMFRNFVSLI